MARTVADSAALLNAEPRFALTEDGRRLSFAEYGDPDGVPFIFMHGIPSSRLAAGLIDQSACRQGIRIIAPDRPGYGLSDVAPARTILDWPNDLTALADHLRIEQFGVLGVSGAVPYLLAAAVAIPERLTHVAILSGLGPLDVPGVMAGMNVESATLYRIALRSPRLGRAWMKMLGKTARLSPTTVYDRQISYLPPVDRAIFEGDTMRTLKMADFAEAFRQGADGAGHEAGLHVSNWGFTLADVTLNVFLWQGAHDRHHPPAMGRYLAGALPSARVLLDEDAGAFGFITRMDAIFDAILDCPTRTVVPAPVPALVETERVASIS